MRRITRRSAALLAFALLLFGLAGVLFVRYSGAAWIELQARYFPPAKVIHSLPGFKVESIYQASASSWISMCIDPAGRLIVSPEDGRSLLRLTLRNGKVIREEKIPQPIGSAMGLLYASNSLFVDGAGPGGWGIYRMVERDGKYERPALILPLDFPAPMMEHGSHGLVIGMDGKLYVTCGDHTGVPPDLAKTSPARNFRDDQLPVREEDPAGFGLGLPPSAGFLLRMDLDGQNCERFAGGGRNTYQIAMNRDGEIFGFDNDAERDLGLPWYRPTRLQHWVAGADFGFRQGNGVLPDYDEDTLPATLNVGLGCATAVRFPPTNCAFPSSYQTACFIADWTYGRVMAVHLIPDGASYQATFETILRGDALNITAMEFGADGALYFITGGRFLPSALYRVAFVGETNAWNAGPVLSSTMAAKAATARAARHQLESFHGRPGLDSINHIWPFLNNADRWLRYSARIALEAQPLSIWSERAMSEAEPEAGLTALLAAVRTGPAALQPELLEALKKFRFERLADDEQLLKLRIIELALIRWGDPPSQTTTALTEELSPLYPSVNKNINHELCRLLLHFGAPGAIARTLPLRDSAKTMEEQIYYATRLSQATNGWSPAERVQHFQWFMDLAARTNAPSEFAGFFSQVGLTPFTGEVFSPFLEAFRQKGIQSLTLQERTALNQLIPKLTTPPQTEPPLQSREKFVRAWTLADLEPHLARAEGKHFLGRGWKYIHRAQCLTCHHFYDHGGDYGPDLTAVGRRMTTRQILESIITPSAEIAPSYQNINLTLRNGDVISGRLLEETSSRLILLIDSKNRAYVNKSDLVSRRVSRVSPMPEGLVNFMTEDQIWDLIGCLHSGAPTAVAAAQN